jgi:hypothetical protein
VLGSIALGFSWWADSVWDPQAEADSQTALS